MLLLVVLVAVRGMDGVVKNVIEAKGSMFTGTAVTLDSMRISLLDQRVKMLNIMAEPNRESASTLRTISFMLKT
jgi:hypothetical protein